VITFTLRLEVSPESLDQVHGTLQSLVGPVRAQPGCGATRLQRNLDEKMGLTFVSEWRSRADLEQHLTTPAFRKVLAVMELASEPPTVEIDELGNRWGFELVEEILGARPVPD